METTVRPAMEKELPRVNEIRRAVNELHVQGRPDVFRAGFCNALQLRLYEKFFGENSFVLVAVQGDEVCGFAVTEIVSKPETPYNRARSYYHVEEIGVDERFRRRGAASALIEYMKADARKRGLDKVELDMWEFKAIPHNSAVVSAANFAQSAACKNLDLPPVNLRFLQLYLAQNSSASAPPHLCGIALTGAHCAFMSRRALPRPGGIWK